VQSINFAVDVTLRTDSALGEPEMSEINGFKSPFTSTQDAIKRVSQNPPIGRQPAKNLDLPKTARKSPEERAGTDLRYPA
jgi:hypothetical protein